MNLPRIWARWPTRAFTLPELLFLVAIVAVLLSLLVGGVGKAKARAQRTECVSNLRQLMLAWVKYSAEHDDRLVLNYRPQLGTNNPPPLPWVQGDYHYTYGSVTNPLFLTDPQLAAFAGTLPNPRVYRCPAVRHDIQGLPLTRSFGMNQYLGAGPSSDTAPGYTTFTRLADVPNPSGIFTFLELNPHIICTSMAKIPMDTNQAEGYFHFPSFLHGGRAALAFADGHVDTHGIRDKDSLRTYPVDWLPDHDVAMTNADVLALRELTTFPK